MGGSDDDSRRITLSLGGRRLSEVVFTSPGRIVCKALVRERRIDLLLRPVFLFIIAGGAGSFVDDVRQLGSSSSSESTTLFAMSVGAAVEARRADDGSSLLVGETPMRSQRRDASPRIRIRGSVVVTCTHVKSVANIHGIL